MTSVQKLMSMGNCTASEPEPESWMSSAGSEANQDGVQSAAPEEKKSSSMDQSKSNGVIESRLLHYKQVPNYLQFNPYIYKGYRPQLTFWGCVSSLFYFHNETVNILTHGLPIMFIVWQIPAMLPWRELRVPLGFFLPVSHVAATLSPWVGSVTYHLFMNHRVGACVYHRLLQLDMLGIWVTQSFGALTTVWAASYCLPIVIQVLALLCYSCLSIWGLFKALTAWSPWERRMCFALPFLMRVIMFAVRISPYGGGHPDALPHVILQDTVSVIGGVIGAIRVPEKWLPGRLDWLGNSHHLMHVLVVVAVAHMHVATSRDLLWMSQGKCGGVSSWWWEESEAPGAVGIRDEL